MSKYNSLVSIIVPIYNTEKYLIKCIDSICNQTYKNTQIILVDDCSTDNSLSICNEYANKDSRIMVIHQENKGVSGARNTGLKFAKGEYIMFVDSDDELYKDAVEVLVNDIEKYNADIASATKVSLDEKGETITQYDDDSVNLYYEEDAVRLSLNGDKNTNSVCAKLFKTFFIKDIFFKEGYNINEDGFFLFQCYMKKPTIVQHNRTIYQYNHRINSNSKQKFSRKHFSMLYFCYQKEKMIKNSTINCFDELCNMKVRTCLQVLDILCSINGKEYFKLQNHCINIVRNLYKFHKPINTHHKKLAKIVYLGLFPLYKRMIFYKYYM